MGRERSRRWAARVCDLDLIATDLEPEDLLATLHAVEAELGRERSRRWAARVCDLDLIA
ncbi:hypothetical protein CNY89_30160, partial [Amaricoccus sp. HAR-UPW-R2A-40]